MRLSIHGRWRRLAQAVGAVVLAVVLVGLIAPLVLQGVAVDGEWRLVTGTVDGSSIPVLTDHPTTLTITAGQVSGNAACNDYDGYLDVSGSSAHPHNIFHSLALCLNDAQMKSEDAYLAALPRVSRVQRDGADLILSGAGVELRFEPVPNPD